MSWLQNTRSGVKKHAEDVIIQPVTVSQISWSLGHQSSSVGPPPHPPLALNSLCKEPLGDCHCPHAESKRESDSALASLLARCPQEALSYRQLFLQQNGAAQWVLLLSYPESLDLVGTRNLARAPIPTSKHFLWANFGSYIYLSTFIWDVSCPVGIVFIRSVTIAWIHWPSTFVSCLQKDAVETAVHGVSCALKISVSSSLSP